MGRLRRVAGGPLDLYTHYERYPVALYIPTTFKLITMSQAFTPLMNYLGQATAFARSPTNDRFEGVWTGTVGGGTPPSTDVIH